MNDEDIPDDTSNGNRRDIFQLLRLALGLPGRKIPLYVFSIAFVISVFLDFIDSPLEEIFGLIGFSGLCIYLGYLLISVLPRGWSYYRLYRFMAYTFIVVGLFSVVIYIFGLAM